MNEQEKESIENIHSIAFAAINQIKYWHKYGALGSTDSLKSAFECIVDICKKHMEEDNTNASDTSSN